MRQRKLDALTGLAFAADDLADMFQLLRHPLVGGDNLVKGVGDLAGEPGPVHRQAHRKITEPHSLQGLEPFVLIEDFAIGNSDVVPVRMEFTDPFLDGPRARQSIGGDFDETVSGRLHARLLQPSHERFAQDKPALAQDGEGVPKLKVLSDKTAGFPELRKSTRAIIKIFTISTKCAISTTVCCGRDREPSLPAPMRSPTSARDEKTGQQAHCFPARAPAITWKSPWFRLRRILLKFFAVRLRPSSAPVSPGARSEDAGAALRYL